MMTRYVEITVHIMVIVVIDVLAMTVLVPRSVLPDTPVAKGMMDGTSVCLPRRQLPRPRVHARAEATVREERIVTKAHAAHVVESIATAKISSLRAVVAIACVYQMIPNLQRQNAKRMMDAKTARFAWLESAKMAAAKMLLAHVANSVATTNAVMDAKRTTTAKMANFV
jgi:hypothetical protein